MGRSHFLLLDGHDPSNGLATKILLLKIANIN